MSLKKVDRKAKDVELELARDGVVDTHARLSAAWQDRTSVLVFLRHFG